MTRETKIGLLVGLAFIIIVGILLSEPLNHAGDAQPAPLPSVGQNARLAINTPGAATTPPPAISTQTQPGGAAAQQPVPTVGEVSKPQRGGITVTVGGNEAAGEPKISLQPEQPAAPQQPVQQMTLSNNNGQSELPPQHVPPQPEPRPQAQQPTKPTVARGNTKPAAQGRPATPPPGNVEGDPIVRGAHDAGEELVTLDGRPVSGNAITPPTKPNKATAKAAKQYEAASGDTLSKMAQKFYGSSSKAYRDAIVAANPSLKGDPNKIMAGETYVIPAIDNGGSTQAAPAPRNEPKAAAKEKSPSLETYYTVKAGDSLWAIARDQCGDPGAVAAIQELNKDSLKGSTSVRIGMKLKLPNKPVASAN